MHKTITVLSNRDSIMVLHSYYLDMYCSSIILYYKFHNINHTNHKNNYFHYYYNIHPYKSNNRVLIYFIHYIANNHLFHFNTLSKVGHKQDNQNHYKIHYLN